MRPGLRLKNRRPPESRLRKKMPGLLCWRPRPKKKPGLMLQRRLPGLLRRFESLKKKRQPDLPKKL